ncbi:MAG: ribonuclease J, partial [Sphingomicrobium sp.]
MIPGEELLFLALGGSGEIGMNVNLYGCRGQWMMADLGLTFADPDYPGIDLILPDLEFIEKNRDRLAGIILTHGHEDHIGALPYLSADLKVPLYATPFTAGLIAGKLEEEGLTGQVKLNIVERGGSVELGPFKVTFVSLSHSIPEGNGLLIETPFGRVFHTGDWKIDDTPVLGEPHSPEVLSRIGDEGVLALVCDSTNVFQDAPSGSEASVHAGLLEQAKKAKGRVLVTTFA